MNNGDAVKNIKDCFNSLSPQLQIAARHILDAPNDVALYSMREMAARSSVKPATMVRLATKLGYKNYNELRDEFRKRISAPKTGFAARARLMQLRSHDAHEKGLVSDIFGAESDNIEQTYQLITDEELNNAAAALIQAEKIYVVGLRKCFPVAYFFHYATRDFFASCNLVQGYAGLFHEEVSHMTERDTVLVVAFDPYTKETVEAANLARKSGAKIIAVTDSDVSPLAADADYVFIAANRSPSFYRSLVGALSIVQSLVAAVVTKLGDKAVTILELSDKRRRENKVYWNV
ncbi:MAG: MurR/RpiR family transcriptional regulator [Sneathiella sp.]